MRHEKIIKLESGAEVKIEVSIWVDDIRDKFDYTHCITFKPAGKRKFVNIDQEPSDGVKVHIEKAKEELWQKLKP